MSYKYYIDKATFIVCRYLKFIMSILNLICIRHNKQNLFILFLYSDIEKIQELQYINIAIEQYEIYGYSNK